MKRMRSGASTQILRVLSNVHGVWLEAPPLGVVCAIPQSPPDRCIQESASLLVSLSGERHAKGERQRNGQQGSLWVTPRLCTRSPRKIARTPAARALLVRSPPRIPAPDATGGSGSGSLKRSEHRPLLSHNVKIPPPPDRIVARYDACLCSGCEFNNACRATVPSAENTAMRKPTTTTSLLKHPQPT